MANVSDEQKQSKLLELTNLISQYNNGERGNINVEEYPKWQLISDSLRIADIDESIYYDFLENPTHYKMEDNQIVLNENWEQEEQTAAQKEIAMLRMTKQDFFFKVIKPCGISYTQLIQIINTDEDVAAAWDLCNHIYRGNEVLNQYIFSHISQLTVEKLDELFKQYGELKND